MAFNLLKMTESHLARPRLPILRAEALYPTEASVELEPNPDGTPNVIGTCQRAAWYRNKAIGIPAPYSAYTHWIFNMGKSVEISLIELWKQMGIWVDNSIRFYNKEYNISGELDCIVYDPETMKPCLTEIKTYSGYEATKHIVGNKSQQGAPKDEHLLQILVYLALHKHIFTYGKLIYLDKTSTSGNAEFDIAIVTEGNNTYPTINGVVNRRFSIEQIFERYKKLAANIANNTLPDRDYEIEYSIEKIQRLYSQKEISKSKYLLWQKGKAKPGAWQCRYCGFSEQCWNKPKQQQEEDEEDDKE